MKMAEILRLRESIHQRQRNSGPNEEKGKTETQKSAIQTTKWRRGEEEEEVVVGEGVAEEGRRNRRKSDGKDI